METPSHIHPPHIHPSYSQLLVDPIGKRENQPWTTGKKNLRRWNYQLRGKEKGGRIDFQIQIFFFPAVLHLPPTHSLQPPLHNLNRILLGEQKIKNKKSEGNSIIS
jgi:hypothetical protein